MATTVAPADNPGQGGAASANTAFSVSGGRNDSTTFVLDGGVNNNLLSNGVVYNPNPDAVAEFQAITNAFYLIRDHPSLDDEVRYYAQLGEQELLRVSHITRQTLSFYRESQQPVAVSLSEILDNIIELQSRKLQLNRIILKKDFRTVGKIQGFSVELKQVFLKTKKDKTNVTMRRIIGCGKKSSSTLKWF